MVRPGHSTCTCVTEPVHCISGTDPATTMSTPKRQSPGFLKWPDALLMLTCNAVSFAIFPALMASISTVLKPEYPFLTETTVGLCFLPIGVATCLGSVFTGKLIDREFKKTGGTNGERIPVDFELEKVGISARRVGATNKITRRPDYGFYQSMSLALR